MCCRMMGGCRLISSKLRCCWLCGTNARAMTAAHLAQQGIAELQWHVGHAVAYAGVEVKPLLGEERKRRRLAEKAAVVLLKRGWEEKDVERLGDNGVLGVAGEKAQTELRDAKRAATGHSLCVVVVV